MSLAPAPYAIGVFPAYCQHQNEVALKIREKKLSITGDDFDITDAVTGAKVFHVNGDVLSLHGRKGMQDHILQSTADPAYSFYEEISDAAGNHFFTLLRSNLHLHMTYHGKDVATDATLFTVTAEVLSWGPKLTCTFRNSITGQEEELHLKGDFFDRNAEITCNDIPVARIGRKFFNAGQLLFDDQTYILTAAPGGKRKFMQSYGRRLN
jgi:uncharacterized protein YxjI